MPNCLYASSNKDERQSKSEMFKLLQNQICEGGGLCAVLHMCPTRNNTGPSTTTKGDIVLNVPCKLYTTIISPHIRSAQSKPEIGSPAHRLIRGTWDAYDRIDIPGRTQRHGHLSLKNDLAQ